MLSRFAMHSGRSPGVQHNGYSHMCNLFQNTFKGRAIDQNALHLPIYFRGRKNVQHFDI